MRQSFSAYILSEQRKGPLLGYIVILYRYTMFDNTFSYGIYSLGSGLGVFVA